MALKNRVQVVIEGRICTLMGSEPEEYIKKVAEYIDKKSEEIRSSDSSRALSPSMVSVLTSLNIADDYFKGKESIDALQKEIADIKKSLDLAVGEKGRHEKELERLSTDNKTLRESALKLESLNRANASKTAELLKERDTARQKNEDLAGELGKARKKADAYDAERNKVKQRNAYLENEIIRLRRQLEEKNNAALKNEDIGKKLAVSENEITRLKKQLEEKNNIILKNENISRKLTMSESEIATLKKQLEEKNNAALKNEDMSRKLAASENEIAGLKKQLEEKNNDTVKDEEIGKKLMSFENEKRELESRTIRLEEQIRFLEQEKQAVSARLSEKEELLDKAVGELKLQEQEKKEIAEKLKEAAMDAAQNAPALSQASGHAKNYRVNKQNRR